MGEIVQSTPGTYEVQVGVDTPAAALIDGVITLEYWQGGAGGAGGNLTDNGGGGGGGYGRFNEFPVVDGGIILSTVPIGGAQNAQPINGSVAYQEDPKLLDDFLPQFGTQFSGGAGGAVTGGGVGFNGGDGWDASGSVAGGGGGSGAGTSSAGTNALSVAGGIAPSGGGNGGNGGAALLNGASGTAPGGGGGGCGDGGSNGGAGGNGKVRLSWLLKPIFTSSSTFTVSAGEVSVGNITANNTVGNPAINGGPDADLFSFGGVTLVFDDPPVAGTYHVTVIYNNTDSFGNQVSTNQDITVNVSADSSRGSGKNMAMILGLTIYG